MMFTDLFFTECNKTNWSSTFKMLKRYIELKNVLVSTDHSDINCPIPFRKAHYIDVVSQKNLRHLDSVQSRFQNNSQITWKL